MLLEVKTTSVPVRALACRHCGAPLSDPRLAEAGFCCSGCAYVFRLIHEHGLDAYYKIKDTVTVPADAAVFESRDYAWLSQAQAKAEEGAQKGIPGLALDIQGISCAGCVWLVEKVFHQSPGARDIVVNAQLGTVQLRWIPGAFDAVQWARKVQAFGYLLGPAGEKPTVLESSGLVKRIGLCAAFTLNVMLFALPAYFGMSPDFEYAGLFKLLSLLFATLSLMVGGTYFISRAAGALRSGVMHIDLPIAIGIVGAYAATLVGWFLGLGRFFYADFVSTFILLMLIGRWAQVAAVERNRRRLLRQQPVNTRLRTPAGPELPRDQIKADCIYLVGPGETVPVESRLEAAAASFSLASISGEADSRVFNPGQHVPAGAVNLDRSDARLKALQPWEHSLLAQLLAPAQRSGHRHLLMERVVRGYVVGILAASSAAAGSWWWFTGDLARAGSVAISVLVVSCPCAIGLALPLVDEVATAMLRRQGLFIRENDLWSKLGRVRKIVFDKTGTLTLESPQLMNPESLAKLGRTECSALLALVQTNLHPIGRCLHEALLCSGPAEAMEGQVEEEIGRGVWMGPWSLGQAGWRDGGAGSPDTIFARAGEAVARFRFSDAVRPGAAAEVAQLSGAGYQVYILSGDRREKVAAMASELGLPDSCALGEMGPAEKAAWIETNAKSDSLMLGDGANDSLAFDCALCRGTPVIHRGVLESKTDFYYLRKGIGGVRDLLETARVHHRTQVLVILFSVVYNLAACSFAMAGKASPLVAAVIMPASSLVSLAIVGFGMRSGPARA